jgi:hypothetical protein
MTKRITLHGKTVEVSDQDYDGLAHLGAEVGVALCGAVFNNQGVTKQQRGHPPRLTTEDRVAKAKTTAADQLHDVVASMKKLRGQ